MFCSHLFKEFVDIEILLSKIFSFKNLNILDMCFLLKADIKKILIFFSSLTKLSILLRVSDLKSFKFFIRSILLKTIINLCAF